MSGAANPLRGARGAEVAAQAKVNLRLRILAREASGFHQLETLFLRLTLADTVRVRFTDAARSLDVTGMSAELLGPTERNLAWRAADAYFDAAGLSGGFALELEKRIPVGGGLGGGSADAGAVLRALDAIVARPLGESALLRLAATLGADVPFLTSEHAYALGWGRGERLLALRPPPARTVVLFVPPFGVKTSDAYSWLAAPRATAVPVGDSTGMIDPASLATWEKIVSLAVNDFEPVVAARHPEIAELVAGLRGAGYAPAMMSGSGSVVFGVAPASGTRGIVAPEEMLEWPADVRPLLTGTATRVERVSALE
jgi:4-diphosphocytidyl-2-C-methyl-D-erythritol kinase